ncbi:helix-turn-helix domain-containing protein, partial [Acinetobacter sp. YH16044]
RQQAFQMSLNGFNKTQIAEVLGVSRQTVINWLKNPQKYILGV